MHYILIYVYVICNHIYICNHENNVPPSYQHNGFMATHALGHIMYSTSCAQVHELPQSHCGDNREDTLIS